MENSGGRTSMALSMDWSFQRQRTFNCVIWLLLHPKQRWECFKGVTLTLAGLTSTSSLIEQGSSLKISPTRFSCDYLLVNPWSRLIDYTDPYDIEYACFMLSKPPPLPQWRALTMPLQPPVRASTFSVFSLRW